jgi:outer membrane receptor protein involved in Fe transport
MLSHVLFAMAMAASDSAASDSARVPPAASPPDTVSRRVVRRLEEVVVRASPLHDILSSESVQIVTRDDLRALPVERGGGAVCLQGGGVARGEDLHVRGGRVGETGLTVHGLALNDARRGTPMELPLLALESVELVSGGLDAEHASTLAGVLVARTINPGRRWAGEARAESDVGLVSRWTDPTNYDRVAARAAGPLVGGLGVALAADLLSDDTYLPAQRTRIHDRSWRADNRLLGFAKLAPVERPDLALEVFASRRVDRPYDPVWSLDGYTTPCANPPFCTEPGFSDEPLPGYVRFRGADHAVMTDEERLAALLSGTRPLASGLLRGAAGWTGTRRLTAVGGRDDEWYLDPLDAPLFGAPGSPVSDPIYVYAGYEPYFQKAASATWTARADWARATSVGNRLGVGAGLTYERVELRELDLAHLDPASKDDSLRSYVAYAPGGFAYGQGRWLYQGLVLNAGLRLEYFTAGPQAEDQSYAGPAHGFWMASPRLGVAFPTSTRDVLSFSYARLDQPPPRDYLYDNRVYKIPAQRPLGNPQLEPQTMISFQAALKHLFDQGRALQLAFFYRDLFGQIGARRFETFPNVFVRRYENADEGHAEGFELGWIHPSTTGRYEIQYTFMHADGTASRPEGFPYGPAFTTVTTGIDPIGDHPLDWDRRHSLSFLGQWRKEDVPATRAPRGPLELVLRGLHGAWSLSWATRVGSGLPWTPSRRNAVETDPGRINAARFTWVENTSASLRWWPAVTGGHLWAGLDVRNLFDFRSERAATIGMYPLPTINTVYDDDGAFRGETGLPGGAYWDEDRGVSGDYWVRIHDPRLFDPPRMLRLAVGVPW